MFEEIRVAAFSFIPRKFDLARNADRMESFFRRAARRGARLALAPEEALDGYPVVDVLKGKISADRMRDAAISINAPHIRRFRDLARELKMCLAFGFAERVGDEIYNCAIFLDHRGRLRGKYHKMLLAEGHEPRQWYNRVGQHSRAIDTPFGRCGFMICNDRWSADLARIPVLDGARFMLIPSYGSRSRAQDKAVMAVARQNGIPVLEANVGLLLLVSKAEIVKRLKTETGMIVDTMAIPAPPSPRNRDTQERRFLAWRRDELPRRYRRRLKDPHYAEKTYAPGIEAKERRR